jgi:predicted RNA-binding Zn-ribbon protein involved in translation (DUF1610 family)
MAAESPATQLTCTQCGGELHPDEGEVFVTCPYCGATVYIDTARVVFHWYLRPTLNKEEAEGALARWMSGSSTVKDLDKKSQVTGCIFQYFPLWYFKSGAQGAQEQIDMEPAAATSVTELARLSLPAGDLVQYDTTVAAQAEPPTVPLDAALEWLKQHNPAGEVRESALVHVPIYIFKYTFKATVYTAVVEGASGTVLANIFPAKAEAPYLTVAGITAMVYLCLALIPLIASSGSETNTLWVAICILIGIIAAPILVGVAAWVASKV